MSKKKTSKFETVKVYPVKYAVMDKPLQPIDEGVKHDEIKPRWDLIPYDALEDVAWVLKDGAKKYVPRNWEKGMAWGRLMRAAIGHCAQFMMGNSYDDETGRHHLAHAACCVLFVLAYTKRDIGTDDRK